MRVPLNTALAEPDIDYSASGIVPRLSAENLPRLPDKVLRPKFAPGSLATGIVHLGCGSFHRAHQALATQHAIAATGDPRWGIASVAMARPDVVTALRAQDNLYTTLLNDGGRVRAEVVGTITEAVHAPTDPIGVARRIADPRVRVVTLTVTTDGYCVSPVTGRLDTGCDRVLRDLRRRGRPRTPIGMVVAGLAEVRRRGGVPPVLISCDNLSANGHQLRGAVIDFAALTDDRLANWIARNVRFPCSVVDRIVQPGTAADAAVARNWLGGIDDRTPVSAEPFLTWTIEDSTANARTGRPPEPNSSATSPITSWQSCGCSTAPTCCWRISVRWRAIRRSRRRPRIRRWPRWRGSSCCVSRRRPWPCRAPNCAAPSTN